MSIRWKFLLILLGFSIVPLLVSFFMNYRVSQELGRDLSDISRGLVLNTSSKELQEAAENYAGNLGRELRLMTEVLDAYAGIIVSQLAEDPKGPEEPVERLKMFMRENRELLRPIGDYLLQQCGDLPGSLTVCLPGFSVDTPGRPVPGRPMNAESGVAISFVPSAEGVSGEHVPLTIAAPLPRLGGSVSLELDLLKLLEKIKAISQWTPFMTSWVARMEADSQHPTPTPRILAVRSLSDNIERWKTPDTHARAEALRFLESAGLWAEFQRWDKGVGSSAYRGAECLWAYAGAPNELVFVNLLPRKEAIYRLTQSARRLGQLYTLDAFLAAASVIVVLIFLATLRSRKMIRPFLAMVEVFRNVSEGDFSARLETTANDERKMVADAFNKMAGQLQESIRIRQALEVAREVQQNFLPESQVNFPGFDIAATVQYCEETGGDYIDFIPQDQRKLGIVVSDVTGHGIGAALLMATARALVRGRYGESGSLADMMNSVNRKLSADIGETGRFMTLFFLEIDGTSRRLQWIRAGHDPAWLVPSTGGTVRFLDGPGLALGVDGQYAYAARTEGSLRPGDTIIIGTDGVWETIGPTGAIFGKERLEKLLVRNAFRSAPEICTEVLSAINDFRGDVKQQDDISLVVIKAQAEDQ
jgi:sigma-B regulation protein RsbU (phosphoserine phosphatase)